MKESPESVTPLLAPLTALQRLMSHFQDKGVVIGGIAASLLGKPRLTADLDALLLLSVEEVPRLIQAAQEEGLEPRIPEAENFARKHRIVLLRHPESGTNIDVSLGILPFEIEVVERSVLFPISSIISIRLPTPEDLIIMKAIAHRPRDFLDIQAIVASHPQLDRQRIKNWVTQFAEVLEMPELWDDITDWL